MTVVEPGLVTVERSPGNVEVGGVNRVYLCDR